MGSRGSVLRTFLSQKEKGVLTVTDKNMTRFNINMHSAINLAFYALLNAKGGEIFIPKMKSFYITDLAKAISKNLKIKIIGIRPGEKVHEEMISPYDALNTLDLGKYYAILNSQNKIFYSKGNYKFVPKDFSYNSKTNIDFLNVLQLKEIIKNFV